jgi:hypothetical protein
MALNDSHAILILEGYMMALIKQMNEFFLFDLRALNNGLLDLDPGVEFLSIANLPTIVTVNNSSTNTCSPMTNSGINLPVEVAQNTNSLPVEVAQNTNSLPVEVAQNTNNLPVEVVQNTNSLPVEVAQNTNLTMIFIQHF